MPSLFPNLEPRTLDVDLTIQPLSSLLHQIAYGGRAFSIPYSIFTRQGYVGSSGGTQYCVGSLVGSGGLGMGNTWLTGDAFLQAVYAVFDQGQNRVGFATKR